MLYHIAHYAQHYFNSFNVFHYVSVRASCAFLSSLMLYFLCGEWFIRMSQKSFRSQARAWTPETHQKKHNTPTMGGLFILLVVLINTLLWAYLGSSKIWIFIFCIVGFGSIGFIDDWLKIKVRKGISARFKFSLQIIVATGTSLLWYFLTDPSTEVCVPFFKNLTFSLSWFLIPWSVFVIVAASNAVNLTDGLDGLATGPLIFNFTTFSIIAYLAGHKTFASYLYIPFAESAELAIVGAALVGTLLGFLWYNTYPAQIFMGDVGSLALGAALGLLALMARQELLIPIAGGIFLLETLSVIIQVASFKFLGRRMFRMAPIHHHFELKGWQEAKITVRFWIISIVLSVIALLTLKLR